MVAMAVDLIRKYGSTIYKVYTAVEMIRIYGGTL